MLLVGITLVSYWGGLALAAATDGRHKRVVLTASIVAVVGALVVFKYYDFGIDAIDTALASIGLASAAPLFPRLGIVVAVGLSFYTFSCVSYLVDVHTGRLPAERHLGHFALYVAFFPKLLAGPIERAQPFLTQLRQPVAFSARGVTQGLQLMLWGLFKKVVIADRLAAFVDGAYGLPAFSAPADLVLATYFFAFQLYCDFSGYSDMAIGASKVLGIDLMENFRRPYFSTSVPEFWAKRWHLSLAGWFRDYMYIPMGGSRVSPVRRHVNVMAVFLVSGLWHGANWTFVVWGGLNGPLSGHLGDDAKPPRASDRRGAPASCHAHAGAVRGDLSSHPGHLGLFRAASLDDAVTVLSRIAGSLVDLPTLLWVRLATGDILLSVALIAVLVGVEALDERQPLWERLAARPLYVRWSVYYVLLICLIVFGMWELQQFVYMQF